VPWELVQSGNNALVDAVWVSKDESGL
jgi:hypothetical protein